MSTLLRIKRILSANVNDLIEKAEDPEKIIKQMIRDMEESVSEARRETAQSMANLKKLEIKAQKSEEEAEKWQSNAEIAVKKGNDKLAKEALKKKAEHADACNSYREEIEKQEEAVDALQASLQELENKLADMKRKRDILISKKRTAEATSKIHGKANRSSKAYDAADTWNRMMEKIEDMELGAEAERELSKLNTKRASRHVSEEDLNVEFELTKLKEELGAGKDA